MARLVLVERFAGGGLPVQLLVQEPGALELLKRVRQRAGRAPGLVLPGRLEYLELPEG